MLLDYLLLVAVVRENELCKYFSFKIFEISKHTALHSKKKMSFLQKLED